MTFPKLRLPTFSEVRALFHFPTSVSGAIVSIERSVAHLEHVASASLEASAKHLDVAAAHRQAALDAAGKAAAAETEAARAFRVGDKLKDLVA